MGRLALMRRFVRLCAAYNVAGAIAFLVPGGLNAFGVDAPDGRFWLLMPAVFAGFAAFALLVSTRDLERYAALPFWNGLARLAFASVALSLGYAYQAGTAMVWLTVGDVVLAVTAIVGIPVLLQLPIRDLVFATAMTPHHDDSKPAPIPIASAAGTSP